MKEKLFVLALITTILVSGALGMVRSKETAYDKGITPHSIKLTDF
ncbi:hypothetical protein [Terribacillus saccharophilus]|nr:hypothetical protein [Terribacillus saccharophilus]